MSWNPIGYLKYEKERSHRQLIGNAYQSRKSLGSEKYGRIYSYSGKKKYQEI